MFYHSSVTPYSGTYGGFGAVGIAVEQPSDRGYTQRQKPYRAKDE